MKYILRRYLIVVASLVSLTQMISAISIKGGLKAYLYAAVIYSLLIYIVRPIANLILFPLNLLTLNMISWIVNIITFYIWTFLISEVTITSWLFPGIDLKVITFSATTIDRFYIYIIGGVVLTIIFQFYNWIIK